MEEMTKRKGNMDKMEEMIKKSNMEKMKWQVSQWLQQSLRNKCDICHMGYALNITALFDTWFLASCSSHISVYYALIFYSTT